MQEQFKEYCRNGDLENAQLLLQQNRNIDIHAEDEDAFRSSCKEGHIEIAKWLHELGADIHACNEEAFNSSCSSGHIEIAKWLYCTSLSNVSHRSARGKRHTHHNVSRRSARGKRHMPHNATHYETERSSVNIHVNDERAFICCCGNDHIEIAKWLHSLDVDIHANNEEAFRWCCQRGHIEIAQWLYSLDVDIHAESEEAFRLSCREGYIEIAQWLYSLGVDIHAYNESAFRWSCHTCNIEIAKWLHSVGVDIHTNNDEAFRLNCAGGHIEIIKWLCEIGITITNDMFNPKYTYKIKKLLVKYTPCAIYARSALYNELIKNYPEDEVKAQFRTKMNEYDIEEDEFDYALKFNECTSEINAEQNKMGRSSIKTTYLELITYFQIVY